VRILWLQLSVGIVLSAVGLALGQWGWKASLPWVVGTGVLLGLAGLFWLWQVARDNWRARIGYQRGKVYFGIARHGHVIVPLEAVECFFLGQAEAGPSASQTKSMNVVVRLAERARTWHEHPVDTRLARWCGGYVTLYGLWCEPLGMERLRELNHQLAEAKRARKQEESCGTSSGTAGECEECPGSPSGLGGGSDVD
jgi:hypothetical protein